jgi:prepilin peptidase CpaA
MLDAMLLLFLPALLAYAAVSDMLTMTIPNRVSLLLIAGFFAVAVLSGLGWTAIGLHVLAGFCVLGVTFGMFVMGWMGGGDAKLAAATALWFGLSGLADYLLVTAVAGGVLTFALMKWRSYPLPSFAAAWSWSRRLHDARSGIPYGVALAFGGLMTYPHTTLWLRAVGA